MVTLKLRMAITLDTVAWLDMRCNLETQCKVIISNSYTILCRVGLQGPINPRVNKTHLLWNKVREVVSLFLVSYNPGKLSGNVCIGGARRVGAGTIPFYGSVYPDKGGDVQDFQVQGEELRPNPQLHT